MNFEEQLKLKQEIINDNLKSLFDIQNVSKSIINGMSYSVMAGGKRIRPILAFSFFEAFEGRNESILTFACSLELIHTYSLIHDDLPAMDNDDYRRGMLTNHKMFGEGMAILAGDALLNYAYEIMFKTIKLNNYDKNLIDAAEIISKSAGIYGMVGGQVIDILSEGKEIDEKTLYIMHNLKTGALIKSSCIVGTLLAEEYDKVELVSEFGDYLGIAFQIVDDILDFEGDSKILGKSIGKDKVVEKPTFVTIFGIEKAKDLANKYSEKALNILEHIPNNDFLVDLTNYLLNRRS